jgi:hypothetical protein
MAITFQATSVISMLNHTACTLARCARFAGAVADVHATLASGSRPTLAGRDSNPDGLQREVSATSSSLPPHPGLAWRTPVVL